VFHFKSITSGLYMAVATVIASVPLTVLPGTAQAVVIDFVGINNAFGTLGVLGQINDRTNPFGATFINAPFGVLQVEGGTSTLGDLTVQNAEGFILNFSSAVSSVRVQLSDNKDLAQGFLRAYATNIVYHTPPDLFSFPPGETDLDTVQIQNTSGPRGDEFFDLTVNGAAIRSVLFTSDRFLTAIHEIEFAVVAVPEPATMTPFALGLLGLGAARWRNKRAA
jgi:hypothetical protein